MVYLRSFQICKYNNKVAIKLRSAYSRIEIFLEKEQFVGSWLYDSFANQQCTLNKSLLANMNHIRYIDIWHFFTSLQGSQLLALKY